LRSVDRFILRRFYEERLMKRFSYLDPGTGETIRKAGAVFPFIPLFCLIILSFSPGPGLKAAGPAAGPPTDKHPEAYKGLSAEEVSRIKAGEVVILEQPENMEGRQMVQAAFMFNQGIDTVWELMTSGWRQEEYLPNLKRSKLIKKWDGGDILEMHVEVLGISINYRILGTRDKSEYHSHWQLDPGYENDMKEVSGFFRFYRIDEDHTLARYGTWVETGIWLPEMIQEYLIKRDLPKALGVQKKWVDSGGTYQKEGYAPPPPEE
jgi:hypothetical protein